jgi:hypothetical protein
VNHHRATLDRVALEKVVLRANATAHAILGFEDRARDACALQRMGAREAGKACTHDKNTLALR